MGSYWSKTGQPTRIYARTVVPGRWWGAQGDGQATHGVEGRRLQDKSRAQSGLSSPEPLKRCMPLKADRLPTGDTRGGGGGTSTLPQVVVESSWRWRRPNPHYPLACCHWERTTQTRSEGPPGYCTPRLGLITSKRTTARGSGKWARGWGDCHKHGPSHPRLPQTCGMVAPIGFTRSQLF